MFCHKCGRPAREIPNLKHADAPDPVIPGGQDLRAAAILPPVVIGFKNAAAVSVAMTISAVAMLIAIFAPLPAGLQFLWRIVVLVVAGFVAVYLYHRRTGEFLTLRSGVRLGWLTGLFSFMISFAVEIARIAAEVATKGGWAAMWRAQFESSTLNQAKMDEVMKIMESPVGMTLLLVMGAAVIFVMSTTLPMLGAALGAKVLEKED